MVRWLWSLVIALVCWASGPGVLAQGHPVASVLLVSSDSSPGYTQAAQAFELALSNAGVPASEVRQMLVSEVKTLQSTPGQVPLARLVVTLGLEAAQVLAQANGKAPLLCALLPRSSFARLLRSIGQRASGQFTALYLDQPLERQLALIRLALPRAKRLGVLLGPESASMLPVLRSRASATGFRLVEAQVDPAQGIFVALKPVLEDSDVLLALPDPAVFGSSSIQNILLSTFRAQVPMVGFSPAYVRAGALLSLHTTPTQVGVQAAALVLQALGGQSLPASPVEPTDFEVEVNLPVAHALGLSLQAQTLRQALRAFESSP